MELKRILARDLRQLDAMIKLREARLPLTRALRLVNTLEDQGIHLIPFVGVET